MALDKSQEKHCIHTMGLQRSFQDCQKGKKPSHLQQEAKAARSNVERFCCALLKSADGLRLPDPQIESEHRVEMGCIKGVTQIIRKSGSQYDGDTSKVDDVCRAQIYTHDNQELKNLLNFISKQYRTINTKFKATGCKSPDKWLKNNLWANTQIRAVHDDSGELELKQFKNHITSPKQWGWMGLTLKLETQIQTGTWVPFEIQIFPQDMKDAYERSHKYYEVIRNDMEQWEKACKTENIPVEEFFKDRPDVLNTLNIMLATHRTAANQCGLLALNNELGGKPFPTLTDAKGRSVDEDDVQPLNGYNGDNYNGDNKKSCPSHEWDYTNG